MRSLFKHRYCVWMVFMFCLVLAQGAYAEPMVHQEAPDFTLLDTKGQSHSLSDFRGQYVVLEWTNYGCPFVKKHYNSGNMQSLQKEYVARDVIWFSIASSAPGKQGYYAPEEWQRLQQEKGASPTAVLLDPEGVVGRLYAAKTTPHMYIIDPQGTLIYKGAIDNRASADPADIPQSQNYVRQTLDQAMAGEEVSDVSTKPYGCSVKYN